MLLAVLIAVVGAACGGGGGGDDEALDDLPASRQWRPMRQSPLVARSAALVWTGKQMLVWGGYTCTANPCNQGVNQQPLNDGAAYDPATDQWRPLAPSPLSPRGAATTRWTGTELLVWGGTAGSEQSLSDGAAYNLATDTWRPIAPSPLSPRQTSGVWTGKELVLWGGRSAAGDFFSDGAAYDPATDQWRLLAESPLISRWGATMAWADGVVVVAGGNGPSAPGVSGEPPARGAAAYRP